MIRECFAALDADGGGSIGLSELEEPLIALGLVEDSSQVEAMIEMVDDDNSSEVELSEFLNIIKNGCKKSSNLPDILRGEAMIK